MARFEMYVDCDGAAFENGDGYDLLPSELTNIMAVVAQRITDYDITPSKWNNVRDSNGNTCGQFRLIEEDNDDA